MTTIRFRGLDGDLYEAEVKKADTAFKQIEQRLERAIPVETIDSDRLKNFIATTNITCSRDLTAKEANTLVLTIKRLIINEIDKSPKYYVSKNKGDTGNAEKKG